MLKAMRGKQSIVPTVTVNDGKAAIEFYKEAFGATREFVMTEPNGPKIAYAELRIGNSYFTLNDEVPQHGALAPKSRGGSTSGFMIYVDDCDKLYAQATAAGAKGYMAPVDMFWGDRMSGVEDPFGFRWALSTHKEDLSEAEIDRRRSEMMKQMASKQK